MKIKNNAFDLAGQTIEPGTQTTLSLPSSELYTQTPIGIPIHVFHGKHAGPKLFVTSTIHGDELNSIEIIRRLHQQKWISKIRGTLITIPVVNIYGFIIQSRYLPDRRDLNRSFPGKESGSLAARLAHILTQEIIVKCQYGIDLHTGAYGRINFPQLRVNLETPGAKQLAKSFEVPVVIDAKIRDGSLRQTASELGIPVLVYEGGEALRFDEVSIRMGVRGISKVMNYLGMISVASLNKKSKYKSLITEDTHWIRASTSGFIEPIKDFQNDFTVKKNELLAHIHDPFLINASQKILAPFDGILIGITNLPIVNEGDAIYHIVSTKRLKHIGGYMDELLDEISDLD